MKTLSIIATLLLFATPALSAQMANYPLKTTPVDADSVIIVDSADLNKTKRATLASLPGTGYTAGTNIDITTGVISVTPALGAAASLDATNGTIGDVAVWVGACTDDTYTSQATCETALETWYAAIPITVAADSVDIADSGSLITATTVEGALAEHRTAINLNTAKVTNTDDQTAAEVSIADSGNLITGETVEAALAENRTAIDLNTAKVTNTDDQTATEVPVTATGFTGNLSGTDTNVQTALATIDAMTVSGSDTLGDLSCTTDQIAKWNGTAWACAADSTAAGAGYVSTVPTYSDEACTAGQYAFNTTTGYVCVASGDWNTFALTNWSEPTPDTTPDAFSFTNQTDVAVSTTITSARVQITGINADTEVSATSGTAAICTSTAIEDCGTFGAAPGDVTNNQYVAARHTSSASASTAVDTVVTVGTMERTFRSTTAAAGTTYSFLYDADHSSGDTYAYGPDGALQGTASGTLTYPAGATTPGTASVDGGNVLSIGSWSAGLSWDNATTAFVNSSEGRVSFEVYPDATISAENQLWEFHSGASDYMRLVIQANSTVRLWHRSGGGTAVWCDSASTATVPIDEWTTIQARWNVADETCGVKVGAAAWVDATNRTGMVAFTAEDSTAGIAGVADNGIVNRPFYFDGVTFWSTYAD